VQSGRAGVLPLQSAAVRLAFQFFVRFTGDAPDFDFQAGDCRRGVVVEVLQGDQVAFGVEGLANVEKGQSGVLLEDALLGDTRLRRELLTRFGDCGLKLRAC
jgi:hypothetical protein